MRTLTYTVPPEAAGRRVKSILLYRLGIPASMIARIKLRETGICVNGLRCRTTDEVKAGDVVTAEVGDPPRETGGLAGVLHGQRLGDVGKGDDERRGLDAHQGLMMRSALLHLSTMSYMLETSPTASLSPRP